MTKDKKEATSQPVFVRVPSKLYTQAKDLASTEFRTLASVINQALKEFFDKRS